MTNIAIFCYKLIYFGLKNVGTTYQCLIDKSFKDLIDNTTKVYVDDMVVKFNKIEKL